MIPLCLVSKERPNLSEDHPSLLIMDVFKCQTTEAVLKVLSNNKIMLQTVPANFTHFFNPLMFKEVQMDTRKDF